MSARPGATALLALAALGLLVCAPGAPGERPAREPAAEMPRLVLLLVVDQLRPDALDPALPGGLGRLAREGRRFVDAALGHAATETCPGHAAIATGRHPGPAGIPGNQWVQRQAGRVIWCVADPESACAVHGGTRRRSARALRATTLGDWMKAQLSGSRVVAVSAKDRGALPLGGHDADAVLWLDEREALGFTTSRCRWAELPDWLVRFNGTSARDGFLAALPDRWQHAVGRELPMRPDDQPGEAPLLGRTSGHPIRAADRTTTLRQLRMTPFLDRATLELARELAEQRQLGRDDVPDLLAISLSATDLVGHFYGPESHEARDARQRLDVWLGELLSALEQASGGRLLVALTSDHGVLPLPEWLGATQRSECPVAGGRIDVRALALALHEHLERRFGPLQDPRAPWLLQAGYELTVNRPLAAARDVDPERVAEAAASYLAAQPGIARVWTYAERREGRGPEPFATLYRNSFDAERSGDLVIQPARGCLITPFPHGTSHGTPYEYDRAVPLVFWGAGVTPGVVRGPVGVVEVAPTLASRLGVRPPADLDGRVLELGAAR